MSSTREASARLRGEGRGPANRREDGFTIVEVLVAIVILTVGVLGALVLINTANGTTLANEARTGGVNLAREVADGSRAVQETVPYSQLSSGCSAPSSPANPCTSTSAIVTALQAQPGLAPDSGSPAGSWEVTREDITYHVKVSVCAMDEPSDGYGSHATGGPFCADVASGGSTDTAPNDYQRLIVDVTWSGTRGSDETRAVALLQSDGTNAPAVTCLRTTTPALSCPPTSTPVISSSATTSVPFEARLAGTANRLVWYVDGTFQGTVNPSGTTATFSWPLGAVGSGSEVFDGTYQLSATAFDVNGKSGTTGSLQVQVNRRKPVAPGGFVAGRDTQISGNGSIGGVDLDWLPVPDKDVLYYRIYQKVGSAPATKIAQTSGSSVTAYTDRTPPANPTPWLAPCLTDPGLPATSTLTYYVVAVDLNGTVEREGTATTATDVNRCNTAPKDPPTDTLQLTQNANGTVTLTGDLPSTPTDPDTGDAVTAVRIYRWSDNGNPADLADRLDFISVSGSSFSFTDLAPRPGGDPQRYCFTNVDKRMQESRCSNVVIG